MSSYDQQNFFLRFSSHLKIMCHCRPQQTGNKLLNALSGVCSIWHKQYKLHETQNVIIYYGDSVVQKYLNPQDILAAQKSDVIPGKG
jgi:hypothetical protein